MGPDHRLARREAAVPAQRAGSGGRTPTQRAGLQGVPGREGPGRKAFTAAEPVIGAQMAPDDRLARREAAVPAQRAGWEGVPGREGPGRKVFTAAEPVIGAQMA